MNTRLNNGLFQAYELLKEGKPAVAKPLLEDALADDLDNKEILFTIRCANFWKEEFLAVDNILLPFEKGVYEEKFSVSSVALADAPKDKSSASPVGRHLDGCRIGFDLGGSDRKCAAVIDGKAVHSEEVVWVHGYKITPLYHDGRVLNFSFHV